MWSDLSGLKLESQQWPGVSHPCLAQPELGIFTTLHVSSVPANTKVPWPSYQSCLNFIDLLLSWFWYHGCDQCSVLLAFNIKLLHHSFDLRQWLCPTAVLLQTEAWLHMSSYFHIFRFLSFAFSFHYFLITKVFSHASISLVIGGPRKEDIVAQIFWCNFYCHNNNIIINFVFIGSLL